MEGPLGSVVGTTLLREGADTWGRGQVCLRWEGALQELGPGTPVAKGDNVLTPGSQEVARCGLGALG